MRRLIVLAFWMLILAWLIAWVTWVTYQGDVPVGAAWALIALTAWWLVGSASREGRRNG